MYFTATRRIVLAGMLGLMVLTLVARPAGAGISDARPGDVVLGRTDAPITMVEYYSLNCSHCGAFRRQIFPHLKADYIETGKVRFVFRDFPLSWAALEAAILTHCAPPERFLSVQDALFDSVSRWNGAGSSLLPIAEIGEANGVERARFKQCVEDGALESQVMDSFKFGHEVLSIDATPTFFINGEKHVGGISLERLAKIFSELLNSID